MASLVVARLGVAEAIRTTMPLREAHDAAARLWFEDPKVQGVVVFDDSGTDVGRYEKPDVALPVDWPPRDSRYVSRDPTEPLGDARPGQRPRETKLEGPPLPPACGCCEVAYPPSGKHEGDVDPTPAGRLDRMRCPECGAAVPASSRQAIELRYLATRREAMRIVEPEPRPTPARQPVDWRRGF